MGYPVGIEPFRLKCPSKDAGCGGLAWHVAIDRESHLVLLDCLYCGRRIELPLELERLSHADPLDETGPQVRRSSFDTVCVVCGRPWTPDIKNVCECGGFSTWGPRKGADPESWIRTAHGWMPKPPPPDVTR